MTHLLYILPFQELPITYSFSVVQHVFAVYQLFMLLNQLSVADGTFRLPQ